MTPSAKTDRSLPTRRSLISRLRNCQDNDSWRDFFQTYWKLIYGFAIRCGCSDAEAEEVVQETVISHLIRRKLFRRLQQRIECHVTRATIARTP